MHLRLQKADDLRKWIYDIEQYQGIIIITWIISDP